MAQKQCPLQNIHTQEKNNEQIFFNIGARPFISAWKKTGCVLKGKKAMPENIYNCSENQWDLNQHRLLNHSSRFDDTILANNSNTCSDVESLLWSCCLLHILGNKITPNVVFNNLQSPREKYRNPPCFSLFQIRYMDKKI
jgi:hypothetical protein